MAERFPYMQIGIEKPVGSESIMIISRLNPTDGEGNYIGNVLRRTCQAIGGSACTAVCGLRGKDGARMVADPECADGNLSEALLVSNIPLENVLMVGVTANEVGFADKMDSYREAGRVRRNPDGWQELPGFNAFFSRPAAEIPALGSRLADCAHLEFEFQDSEGQTVIGFEHGTRPNMAGRQTVIGFEHGTRPNMAGPDKYAFVCDGEPVSYTHLVMASAFKHYGADPATVQLRLSSSIRPENFVKRFATEEQLEDHIPGWRAAGFARNISNPRWQPGMAPVSAEGQPDVWHADARGLILRDITAAMQALGVPGENFACDNMLDPADTAGEFSSHQNRDTYGDTRDLYLLAHRSAFCDNS